MQLRCRIRNARERLHIFKIPLQPRLAPAEGNAIPNKLPRVQMPAAGPIGVAIDGVPLYTNYNHNGFYTWTSCELDACNGHVHDSEAYHCNESPGPPAQR